MLRRPAEAVRLAILLACVAVPLGSQEPGAQEAGRHEEQPALTGDLRRGTHSALWPFYSREDYEDGSHRHSSFFGLYRNERLTNGDYRHRLIPFYESVAADSGRDRRLSIYPLLYFGRESPHASYDLALPLFANWADELGEDTLLWPFAHVASSKGSEPYRFIPTLFSHGDWVGGSAQRLGLPYVLDVFERLESDQQSSWTAGVIAPWGPPTRFGLSIAKGHSSKTTDAWHSHVFPFYYAGEGGNEDGTYYVQTPLFGRWRSSKDTNGYSIPALLSWWWSGEESHGAHVLFPLIMNRANKSEEAHRVLPFYAVERRTDGSRSDLYLPFALSRFRSGTAGTATDVLWPLFHSSESESERATRVLPFYDRHEDDEGDSLGVGGFLYRRHRNVAEDRTSHWYLFPLGLRETSKTGYVNWALPFYLDARSETETHRSTNRLYGPLYFSREEDELSPGGEWVQTRSWRHAWPFYGRHRYRPLDRDIDIDIRTHWILAPFFRRQETLSAQSSYPNKIVTNVPWPIVWHEWTRESWDLGVFPFLFTGNSPVRSYFRIYPALSIERGPWAEQGFFSRTNVIQWFDDDAESRLSIEPFIFEWRRTEHQSEVHGPLWIFSYRDSDVDGWFHLFPIGFGSWGKLRSEIGVFPLFYHRDFDQDALTRWTLGRFLFVWNSMENDRESYDSVLWEAFEYTRSTAGDYDFRILHRLFVNRQVSGQEELTVNPFFSVSSDALTGDSALSILGFVYRERVEDGVTKRSIFGIPF